MAEEIKALIPRVDDYEAPKAERAYVWTDGKRIRINLKKCLPKTMKKINMNKVTEHELESLETFNIDRKLFVNKVDVLCQYMDYYLKYFDEDKELITSLISMKKKIDSRTESMTTDQFINMILREFFRDSHLKKNIFRLVDYNYNLDVTVDAKSGRLFVGEYDFTNDDAKALLGVSIALKFVIPLASQYIYTNTMYTDEALNEMITDVFMEIFDRMSNHYTSDPDTLLLKLYRFTADKIAKHAKDHKTLWNHQSALRGLTEDKHIDTVVVKHLVSNNMFKFTFSYNITSFLKSIVETQLSCTINKVKYKADPIHVDTVKDVNGLSGIDKLEQSLAKMDETAIIRCSKSLNDILSRLEAEVGEITEEEVNYYCTHFTRNSKFHSMLLNYFYAKEFGGFTELKNKNVYQHMRLLIAAKRKLFAAGYTQLPHLLSSVNRGKTSQRLLQSQKYTTKLTNSETYQMLQDEKYIALKGYREEIILSIISQVLNTTYSYVDYVDQDLTGEKIVFDEDIISDELIMFIEMI